ncbi:MAG: Amuc_1098 family type IV pilus outer membrane protein [Verrucomicrobiota bacterium]
MHSLNTRPARQYAVSAAVSFLALAGSLAPSFTAQAGEGSTSSLADKEVQRRTTVVTTQQARLPEAESLLKNGNSAAALVIFEEAYLTLPDVPLAQETRAIALDGYLRAGLARAKELVDAGDYPAANAILDKLDQENVAKGDSRIARLRERFGDPDRYPPALTPEHIAKVSQVEKLLLLANSQRETGQHDKALLTYEEVLRVDPYNTAARRGMETTEKERSSYFDTARDHRRSKMLNDVNEAWENKPPLRSRDVSGLFGDAGSTTASGIRGGREAIQQKLRDLKISQIDFSGATLEEVMEYLRVRARDLDPTGKGVDFVVSIPADHPARPISLNLKEVPIEEVLRYVTEIAGITYRVEDYAVRLVSLTENSGVIISKSYRVPPDFITSAPVGGAAAAPATADPFAAANTAGTASGIQIKRIGAQEFLQSYGVTFGEGTGANYSPSSNMLVVRNTASNLEIVDMLVEQALNRSPKQVVVEVRLLEVGDNRLDEIGFDWLLGAFGVNNGQAEMAGGSIGNALTGANFLTGDFPFQKFVAPGVSTAIGMNPLTTGLRSSGDLGNNSIDSVLFGAKPSVSRRSPGVLSVSGVLSNPEFQGVLRALAQKKGIDLASQPSVVTRSGQKASVEITRELIYPTEFDPPQIPTNFGQSNIINNPNPGPGPLPTLPTRLPPAVVTPSTPTAFEMRKTGVVLDVEPVISDDGRTVDLTVTPQFTEFSGFVNYGSPIRTLFEGSFLELTPNLIFQPVFDSRKIITSVKIYDGATVVLGGLVTDQVEIIADKVPLLGDAPFIGRLFKSDVKRRRVRHVLFFVTVRVVDPSGARINQAAMVGQ